MDRQAPTTVSRIEQQQLAVAQQTRFELKEYDKGFQNVLDALLALLYAFGADPPARERLVYQWWARASYVSVVHTLIAMQQLSRVGLYLEAKILHRHISDVLVQVAYFCERPAEAEKHFVPGIVHDANTGEVLPIAKIPKAHKARFDTMFKEVAPDYFATDYRMASEIAHGSIASAGFRSDLKNGTATIGVSFHASQANYLILESTAIAHGLLHWFPRVFPAWDRAVAGIQYDSASEVVRTALDNTWTHMPEERPWLTRIAPLILWSVPS